MKAWLERLEPRERWILSGGAALAVLIVFWGLLWLPLEHARAALRQSVADKRALLSDVRRGGALQQGAASSHRPALTKSLVVLVDQTARAQGLASSFTRTRPDGSTGISVSFQNAAFDDILAWLAQLHSSYGVSVESASFTGAQQHGLVTGQVFLRRS